MPYLSLLLGKRVRDSVGQPLGVIADLAVTVKESFGGDFPPVTLVLVRAGKVLLRLRWELIADLNEGGRDNAALLDSPRAHLTIGAQKGGEIFLCRDVDVSLRGILRRVGMEEPVVGVAKKLKIPLTRRHIPWNEVEVLQTEFGGRIQLKVPVEKLSRKHPTDLAAIVHQMNPAERTELFEQLDVETAAEALEEMDPDEADDVQGEVESADAILGHMDDQTEAADIKHLLSYDEGTAGALMTTEATTVRGEVKIEEAFEKLRAAPPEPSTLHYLHIEDDEKKLLGVVCLAQAVLAAPSTRAEELEIEELVCVTPDTHPEECARLIAKYDLLSLPVVDLNKRLLGIVTVDDVLDIIAPEEWSEKLPRAHPNRETADSTR